MKDFIDILENELKTNPNFKDPEVLDKVENLFNYLEIQQNKLNLHRKKTNYAITKMRRSVNSENKFIKALRTVLRTMNNVGLGSITYVVDNKLLIDVQYNRLMFIKDDNILFTVEVQLWKI